MSFRILFICYGNICGSPLSEFVMKDMVKKAGLDRANLQNVYRICGGDFYEKMHLLMDYTDRPGEVADPWYTDDFEATWRDVEEGCRGLLNKLMVEGDGLC